MSRLVPPIASIATAVLVCTCSLVRAETSNIVDTAVAAGQFKTLAAALEAAGLVEALQGPGPFTVFAPTDEAFAALPAETLETLLKPENKSQLTGILTYHVVPGDVKAADVVKLTGAKTLNGQFVDTNAVNGGVTVDGASVVKTDIECSNGTIHVIDRVLLPASEDIVATAANAGDFSTLITAVKAAGLAEVLASDGPFTVFAPTDEAFRNLPDGTLESLLKPENRQQLGNLLKYHVVPGRLYSPDALAAGTAPTLAGRSVTVSADVRGGRVNDARLLTADIDASNGVIHVIDRVLLPGEGGQANLPGPRDMIVHAINRGAPLYNAGHHQACAQIYRTTLESIVSQPNHGMCAATVDMVRSALDESASMSSADARAWKLRHTMDHLYATMNVTP